MVSVNGGGKAATFVARLIEYFGIAALSIKSNPALRHITLVVEASGNDWTWNAGGKKHFHTPETLPKAVKKDYEDLCTYSQAFGASAWIGIGSAEIFSGKKNGVHFDAYNQMASDLRTTVQEFGVVLTSERPLMQLNKRDTQHFECTMHSTRLWCEIVQDAYELCKLVRRFDDLRHVF